MLDAACGACQNRTFISWTMHSQFCPAQLTAAQGTYTQLIPSGTVVPHWAYLKPSDNGDFFDADAAKLVGGELFSCLITQYAQFADSPSSLDTPESSQIPSSTTSSGTSSTASNIINTSANAATGRTTSTSKPTHTSKPSGGGGGGGGSNTGAIVGGVVGGVLGLAILALIAFLLLRRRRAKRAGAVGAGGGHRDQDMTAAGAGAGAGLVAGQGHGNGQQYPNQTGGSDPAHSQYTNPTTNGSGVSYNQYVSLPLSSSTSRLTACCVCRPMDPNMSYAAPPQQPTSTGYSYGTAAQYHQPPLPPPQQQPHGQYSGMPEV